MRNAFLIIVTVLSCTLFTNFSHADDGMKMPASMEEFVNWHLDRGACGTWVETGVTEAMWTGIPAGLRYTSTTNMWYEPETGQLLRSHHWVTDDGRVLSTGASLMYWDAEKGAPAGSSSGYDQGKPYHGTSVLKGMNADTIITTPAMPVISSGMDRVSICTMVPVSQLPRMTSFK